jgi:hypothetical protein
MDCIGINFSVIISSDIYDWVNTSAGGVLVPEGIIIINTLLNFDSYRVGIVNGSRTIKLPIVSDANRNKGNNKITKMSKIFFYQCVT